MTAVVAHHTGQVPAVSRRRLLGGPFRGFLGGQVSSQMADAITTLTLAQVIVFDIGKGATPGAIARALAVSALPVALAGPFAGRIADRWQRQRVLSLVGVLKAVATAAAMTVPLTRNPALGYAALASCSWRRGSCTPLDRHRFPMSSINTSWYPPTRSRRLPACSPPQWAAWLRRCWLRQHR